MHDRSLTIMGLFFKTYLDENLPLRILDVGSKRYEDQHTYRDLLLSDKWQYVGMDLEAGDNVDFVAEDPCRWPFEDNAFDVVISGQCVEHTADLPSWFNQLERVLKPGGLTCVVAPWCWPIHRYPFDFWRILPDGMRYLLTEYAHLEVMEIFTKENMEGDEKLGDCVGLARKPD